MGDEPTHQKHGGLMPCPDYSECPIVRPVQEGPETAVDGDGEEVAIPEHALM